MQLDATSTISKTWIKPESGVDSGILVSTIFYYEYGIYETLVIGGDSDDISQETYSRKDALRIHQAWVNYLIGKEEWQKSA